MANSNHGKQEQASVASEQGGAMDQQGTGPTSINGVEASELPGEGRGSVDTDPGKELGRRIPGHTGAVPGGDVGLRGTPNVAEAADHGHRKHN